MLVMKHLVLILVNHLHHFLEPGVSLRAQDQNINQFTDDRVDSKIPADSGPDYFYEDIDITGIDGDITTTSTSQVDIY